MSRFHFSFLLIPVLFFLFWIGCADDLRHRNLFDDGVEDVVLSFSVENISLSRSEERMNMESDIDHAYLLFYPSDAVLETSVPIAAVRAEVTEQAPYTLKFKMPLLLEPDTDYRLLAVANADRYVPEGFDSFKDYLEAWSATSSEIRQQIHLFRSDPIYAGSVDCLPMRGFISGDAPFRFSRQNGAYRVSASLMFRRTVARVDVANMVGEGFDIEGIALCNWRDAVAIASAESPLGNRFGTVRGILSGGVDDSKDLSFVEMPSAENGVQQLKESLYCFPSVSYDSYSSDKESTALIIKARYGDDTSSSYYRVNVGSNGNKSEVKANTKYLVTIQSVNGRGASTPEEAYAAEESPIVLSVVEDWDLDGCFAMDEDGNFLLLSTGLLEFGGNEVENREVRVRTSNGLSWNVEYVADNDASSSAFSATRLSDFSLAIGPAGKNTGEETLSGKFVVSTATQNDGLLSVDIRVSQKPVEESENPEIPVVLPYQLVPLSTDRVKIDHNERTVEIDAFDPDCFNSFIDIQFTIKCVESDKTPSTYEVSTDLEWPLEGRISKDTSSGYFYCKESFSVTSVPEVRDINGKKPENNELLGIKSISVGSNESFFISVGAMCPDDPAIIRNIILADDVAYRLIIKPRPCIIDDIILSDGKGGLWVVQDRNVQDFEAYSSYIGLKNGRKRQAYNYTYAQNLDSSNEDVGLTIPFKFKANGVPFDESEHSLYLGKMYTYNDISNIEEQRNDAIVSRWSWLKRYLSSGDFTEFSPFYDIQEGISKWVFPIDPVMELWRKKLKVSKMRLFFVSDVAAKDGEDYIPVCCYLPCHCLNFGNNYKSTYGYFRSDGSGAAFIDIFYFDHSGVKRYEAQFISSRYDQPGVGRLVRQLSESELDDYKTNYLGYGSQPLRLQLCHPDTYTSKGWLPE